ncbi:MAG: AEC family transporter [Pseudomonadota bacterium]|nr:transporter [Pseudomonadales bacterium]MDY6922103.1 AEC family transporter [Pseudomonadota bacterium]
MLQTLLPVTGPVMVCILVGFVWNKLRVPYDTEMVTRLVMCVGAPCLVVSSMTEQAVSRGVIEQMAVVTLVLVGVTLLAATLVLAVSGQSLRALLGPLVFPNTGNMGLPVCLFAFGDEGLVLAIAVFMVISLVHFTLGIALVSGRSVVQELVRNPIIYSIAAALVMIYGDLELPRWGQNTVGLLGDMTIPLMLITLGVSLAGLRVTHLGRSLLFGSLRLIIGALVGWGVAQAFDLRGAARGVVILQSAMPVAVFNYLFAMRYGREPQVVAGMVMVSTLLSFLLLPALVLYLV